MARGPYPARRFWDSGLAANGWGVASYVFLFPHPDLFLPGPLLTAPPHPLAQQHCQGWRPQQEEQKQPWQVVVASPCSPAPPPWEPGVRGLWAEVRPETDVIFQLREHSTPTLTHTDMHARILTHPHIRTHACTYVHIHAHSHTYTHACTHTQTRTHTTHTL